MDNAAIHNVFEKWSRGRLHSYLIEITRDIFEYIKTGANHPLLEDIKDQARAKGTGKWASQVAIDLDLSIPVIDVAVSMRNLSEYKDLRIKAFKLYTDSRTLKQNDKTTEYIDIVEQAFYFAMISDYTQGMHLLHRANDVYDYNFRLDLIAKVWRGGCIIRLAFLEDVYAAYNEDSNLEHLFLNENIHKKLTESLSGIRKIVSDGALNGIPALAFSAALGYFDSFRSEEMPTNLIQAQRDYFGSHTYELIEKKGTFHTQWKDMD